MQNQNDEQQWKDSLTAEQYSVMRKGATEAPFSGSLLSNKADGSYHCAACNNLIFSSDTKFDSGSGWPSFTNAIENSVTLHEDNSHGMIRTEVKCAQCDSHLGHVFNDGPNGNDRFCINSVCLNFNESEKS